MTMTLILASGSPRRRELLARAGVTFEVVPPEIDETARPGETPSACAARLAQAKAEAVWRPGEMVLGADTVVVVGDRILGKPADENEAFAMLIALSARTHLVVTATCLKVPYGDAISRVCTTEVDFVALTDRDLSGYLKSGEWRGKAGAYAAQGIAAAFVAAVRGSFTNVIGLPLAEVLADLRRAGAEGADLARGTGA